FQGFQQLEESAFRSKATQVGTMRGVLTRFCHGPLARSRPLLTTSWTRGDRCPARVEHKGLLVLLGDNSLSIGRTPLARLNRLVTLPQSGSGTVRRQPGCSAGHAASVSTS